MKSLSPLRGSYTPIDPTILRSWIILFIALILVLIISGSTVSANTIGEEFSAVSGLKKGLVVSLDKNNPENVELSTIENSVYLLGVVNDLDANSVTYAKNSAEISVSLTGDVAVYVNDANGEIKKGDFIGVSWLDGVGMKALMSDNQKLVGIALEDFDSSSAEDYGKIKIDNGDKEIKIGTIQVRLFNKEGIATASTVSPSSLQNFIRSLTGKEVSFTRVVAGVIIFLVGLTVAGFFINSSIKGSFISIGRNPLAGNVIYRSLFHVTTIAVTTVIIGAMLSYVVLVL